MYYVPSDRKQIELPQLKKLITLIHLEEQKVKGAK